jgi:hypothetical protein
MAASGKASGKARRSIAATAAYEFFSLEAVDFGQLKQDVSGAALSSSIYDFPDASSHSVCGARCRPTR